MGKKRKKKQKNDNIENMKNELKIRDNNVLLSRFKVIGKAIINVVTITASIATCLTVQEMRNERNQAYRPYFIIEKMVCNEKLEKSVYNIHDTNNLVESLLKDANDLIPMAITIDNIGSGTATNIKVDYSCEEYKDYWKIICNNYNDDDIVQISNDELRVKYYLSSFGENEYKHSMNTSDLIVEKPYVFSKEKLEIPIPEEYRRLFFSVAYCTNGDFQKLPKIKLEIYYDDLQGITYHKTFKISVDIKVDSNSDDKLNLAKYVIEQYE